MSNNQPLNPPTANSFAAILKNHLSTYEGIITRLRLPEIETEILKNWLNSIRLMECLTARHFRFHNIFTITTIIAGILIPVTINLPVAGNLPKILSTILGVLASVSASINQSYKFNDRWRHFRLIAEALKIEGDKFMALTEKYKSFDHHGGAAFQLFTEQIESIKEGQINSYMRKIVQSVKGEQTREEDTSKAGS